MNRAERLVARAAGLPGPSDAQLRANLERRASFLSPSEKRFNRPSSDYLLPSEDSDSGASSLAVENDECEFRFVLCRLSYSLFLAQHIIKYSSRPCPELF